MQTVLLIRSASAGAVYANGRLVGDIDPDRSVSLPVSPFGPVIVEFRPFQPGLLPLTLRIPFSQGVPLVGESDQRYCAALWPDGLVEIELLPEPSALSVPPRLIAQSGETRLFMTGFSILAESPAGSFLHPLPDGASTPTVTPLPTGLLLSGSLPDASQYALILSPDGAACPLALTGQSLSLLEGGALRIIRSMDDTVGHAALETWASTPQGWQRVSSEPMWASGSPSWPSTPESTAIAAVEAAQLGHSSEAAAYFSPAFPCADLLRTVAACDGCTPLRAPLLSGESAIGLMKMEQGLLRIHPLVYRASPGGSHGWQIDFMRLPAALSS